MNMSDSKILSGKKIVIPTWELTVGVTPMIGIAGSIFSAETHYSQFVPGMHAADDLQFDIVYDNTVINSLRFLNNQPQITTHTLVDDHTNTNHTLQFVLSGKNDSHSYHTNDGGDVSWILKIDLYIENLSMTDVVDEQLDCLPDAMTSYMGENGTKTLKIQTPIYRWLLTHDNTILMPYRNL